MVLGSNMIGLQRKEDIPTRLWKCANFPKEQVDSPVQSVLCDCNGLGGISGAFAPQDPKNDLVQFASSQTRIRLCEGSQIPKKSKMHRNCLRLQEPLVSMHGYHL